MRQAVKRFQSHGDEKLIHFVLLVLVLALRYQLQSMKGESVRSTRRRGERKLSLC